MDPLVSVLIPTFNRSRYIRRAVESVLADPHQNVELVIVDDGSTDDTESTVANLVLPDRARLKYRKQSNSGGAAARNAAAEAAEGEYLLFLDSDDLVLPGKIQTAVYEFSAQRNIVAVCSNWFMRKSDGYDLPRAPDIDGLGRLLEGNPVSLHVNLQTSSPVWSAEFWREKRAKWPEGLFCWQENSTYVPLLLGIRQKGYEVSFVHEPLYVQDYSAHTRVGSYRGTERYLINQVDAFDCIMTAFRKAGCLNREVKISYESYMRNLLRQALELRYEQVWKYALASESIRDSGLLFSIGKSVPFDAARGLFRLGRAVNLVK